MDLDVMAGWSREVVGLAVVVYIVAWAIFCAELGARVRQRRALRAASLGVEATAPQLATVAAGSASAGDASGASVPGHDASPSADEVTANADRLARMGRSFVVLATAVLAIGVLMRAFGTGRVPWGNMFEFSITGSLVASVVFLVVGRRPIGRAISAWVVLVVFVTLALAVTVLYVPPGPLVPALRSYWMVVHVGAAVTAFGLFTVAAVVSALQIISERARRRGATDGFGAALPAPAGLDRLAYRLTAIAFPIWTLGPLILGAVWAEVSWGRYWNWDPKETWALITWLAYAAYLHARATAGWKGAKSSGIGLIGFATLVFSYFGVNLVFTGLHSYGGL